MIRHLNADFECTTKYPVRCYLGYVEDIENQEKNHVFHSVEEFMNILYRYRRANVYFHNLEYDGSFIFSYLLSHMGYVNLMVDEYSYGFDKIIVGEPSRFTIYKRTKDDWYIFNFIDTFKIISTSVRKLGNLLSREGYSFEKGETPLYKTMEEVNARSKEQVEYDENYCIRDVQIVSEYIKQNDYLSLFEQGIYTASRKAMMQLRGDIKERPEDAQFKPLCSFMNDPVENKYEVITWEKHQRDNLQLNVNGNPVSVPDIVTHQPKFKLNVESTNQELKELFEDSIDKLERNLELPLGSLAKRGFLYLACDTKTRTKSIGDIFTIDNMSECIDCYDTNWLVESESYVENGTLVLRVPQYNEKAEVVETLEHRFESYWKRFEGDELLKRLRRFEHNWFLRLKRRGQKDKLERCVNHVRYQKPKEKKDHREYPKGYPRSRVAINRICKPHYKGGISYTNPIYQGKIVGHGWSLDINSMHPGNMRNQPLPAQISEIYSYSDEEMNNREEQVKLMVKLNRVIEERWFLTFILFDKLKATCHEDALPILKPATKDEVNALKDDGYQREIDFDSFGVTDIEYQYLMEHYDIHECRIKKVICFEQLQGEPREQLNDFIDTLYEQKARYGLEGNEMKRYEVKLTMNSCYGQLGMFDKEIPVKRYVTVGEKVESAKRCEPYYITSRDSYVPMAMWITAYSRVCIGETACALGMDKFLYTDTDSIHFLSDITDKDELEDMCTQLGIKISDTNLGEWKIEGEFVRGVYIKSKTYMEEVIDGDDVVKSLHACGYNGTNDIAMENFRSGYAVAVTRSTFVEGGRQIFDKVQIIDSDRYRAHKEVDSLIEETNLQLVSNVYTKDEIKEIMNQLNQKLTKLYNKLGL